MGRPREFETDQAISDARDAFWAHGVAATSISDLSEATGLSVGSIYKAFESKEGLCHRTLDSYLGQSFEDVRELLRGEGSPRSRIELWLESVAVAAASESPTRGCYAVACATELAAGDAVVRERLRRHDVQVRGELAQAIQRARDAGELSCDPEVGARMLAATANGVSVEARKGISLDDARSILSLAVSALE